MRTSLPSLPTRVRLLVAATLVALAAACTSSTEPLYPNTPIEQTKFADSLHIDLAKFTRLSTGMYVRDSITGTGAAVSTGQPVTISYVGFLANGTIFDQSSTAHPTFTFTVGSANVIAGFNAGVQGMRAGGRRRMIIPPELAYGNRTDLPFPPNSVLLFDVTVVSVP